MRRDSSPLRTGPAEWFTGAVYVDDIAETSPPSHLRVRSEIHGYRQSIRAVCSWDLVTPHVSGGRHYGGDADGLLD